MNITVYSKPNCPQCAATKRQLNRRGFNYTVIDISDNPQTIDQLRQKGWQQMPVVIADDESWSGYRPDNISALKVSSR